MEIIKIPANKKKTIYQEKLNVGAYIRVSTKLEAQQNSFLSQKLYFEDKISKMANWNLVNIYSDEGISGKSSKNRKGFQKMIEDAEEGLLDIILIKSLSRFARNTVDSLKYIRRLKELGVAVYFEEEHINTMNIASEMLITLFSAIAQIESENIGSRISMGVDMKLKTGEYKSNRKIYGYRYNKSGKIVLKKRETYIVRLIFKMSIEGKSHAKIAEYINDNNLDKSKIWNKDKVRRILFNTRYYGEATIKGNVIKIDTPRIITKDIYDKAHKVSSPKFETNIVVGNKDKLFYKKLRCGFCGRGMVYIPISKNNEKLNCVCKARLNGFKCEGGVPIREDIIFNSFIDLLNEIKQLKLENINISEISKRLKQIDFKINILINKKSYFAEQLLNKKINKNNYDLEINKLNTKISFLEKSIEKELYLKNKRQKELKMIKNIKKQLFVEDNYEEIFNNTINYIIVGEKDKKGRRDFCSLRFIINNQKLDYRKTKEEISYVKLLSSYSFQNFDIRVPYVKHKRKLKITLEYKEEENGSRSN